MKNKSENVLSKELLKQLGIKSESQYKEALGIHIPNTSKQQKAKEKPRTSAKQKKRERQRLLKLKIRHEKSDERIKTIESLNSHRLDENIMDMMFSARELGCKATKRSHEEYSQKYLEAGISQELIKLQPKYKKRKVIEGKEEIMENSRINVEQSMNCEEETKLNTHPIGTILPMIAEEPEPEVEQRPTDIVSELSFGAQIHEIEEQLAQIRKEQASEFYSHEADAETESFNKDLRWISDFTLEQKKIKTQHSITLKRSKECWATRNSLPILMQERELMENINNNIVTIICGETGSGKSTQMPQFLYENGYQDMGRIGITQPRRVAAVALATRVSSEMGLKFGREVGYQIRFDAAFVGKHTKIKVDLYTLRII